MRKDFYYVCGLEQMDWCVRGMLFSSCTPRRVKILHYHWMILFTSGLSKTFFIWGQVGAQRRGGGAASLPIFNLFSWDLITVSPFNSSDENLFLQL